MYIGNVVEMALSDTLLGTGDVTAVTKARQ